MNYLNIDQKDLVNLEYSLNKEILRTNRAGSFALSSIIFCNTRKYHGLLICPIPNFGDKRHVLLSSLDESIAVGDQVFNLGLHRYAGNTYYPLGHRYITNFHIDNVAKYVYKIGTATLRKENVMIDKSEQILIRYTLEDCDTPITIRFRPFTAFRSIHALSKANSDANTDAEPIANGMKYKMYDGFPYLHMQFSKKVEYVHEPRWNYNIEYTKEIERGYEGVEDLMVPGYFELKMKKGETVVFSASTLEENPTSLKKKFEKQESLRVERNNMEDSLINAGNQFFVKKENDDVYLYAGYPWHGIRGRETFIAMPGLRHSSKDDTRCENVLNTMIKHLKNGLFPNLLVGYVANYETVDASLWFIRAIQLCFENTKPTELWNKYGSTIKEILNAYKHGTSYNIRMHDNALIYADGGNIPLTWMNAEVDGIPVTPRAGYQVEVNALWYNAVSYALTLAKAAKDKPFLDEWNPLPERIGESFINNFWNEHKGYCADCFTEYNYNWEVRPNMIIATALPFSPLSLGMKKSILEVVEQELLTPKGLRTLSPESPSYQGKYRGNPDVRRRAAHQGSVWPWLLEAYYETYLNVYGDPNQEYAHKLLAEFESDLKEHGIGTISEIYEGNPEYLATGAISYACSVGALLRIMNLSNSKKK